MNLSIAVPQLTLKPFPLYLPKYCTITVHGVPVIPGIQEYYLFENFVLASHQVKDPEECKFNIKMPEICVAPD